MMRVDSLNKIRGYLDGLKTLFDNVNEEEINALLTSLIEARKNKKQIFIFGNGGSGSNASHFTCDLNKGASSSSFGRFKIICLNDNIPTILAYANDLNYESIFVEQLKNFLEPGDLVIGISGSGNSKNVIKTIEYANSNGANTIGLCGFDGGQLKQTAKKSIHIKSNDMQKIEDLHIIIFHLLMQILKEEHENLK